MVSISGSKFRDPSICDIAYKDPIKVKSVHFIGEKDWLKVPSEELASAFDDPLIIRHHQGHTVPRLGSQSPQIFLFNLCPCLHGISTSTVFMYSTSLLMIVDNSFADDASVKQLSGWSSSILESLKNEDVHVPKALGAEESTGAELSENLVEQVTA
jgi:calmodulin